MKKMWMALAAILSFTACVMEDEDFPDYTRVELHSEITGVQPMTGLVVWNTSSATQQEYVQLEFSYMLYNDVCKEKDVFDWTPMDRLLEQVAARGNQAIVRFRYTYPGYKSAVPDYIKALPDYEVRNSKSEGKDTGRRLWAWEARSCSRGTSPQ